MSEQGRHDLKAAAALLSREVNEIWTLRAKIDRLEIRCRLLAEENNRLKVLKKDLVRKLTAQKPKIPPPPPKKKSRPRNRTKGIDSLMHLYRMREEQDAPL